MRWGAHASPTLGADLRSAAAAATATRTLADLQKLLASNVLTPATHRQRSPPALFDAPATVTRVQRQLGNEGGM